MFNDVQRLKVHRLHVILPITSLDLLLLLPFGKHKDPTYDVGGWLVRILPLSPNLSPKSIVVLLTLRK